MKKRVLSLFMALALCLSMTPEVLYAEEAGVVTEQEVQSGESITDDTIGNDVSGNDVSGGDVSDGDADVQDAEEDAAVRAVQALIDALPENITAENADELEAQMIAIGEALAALIGEQLDKLNMTRYEDICAALTGFVAVQDGGHTNHPVCGLTCTHENKHDDVTEWEPISNQTDFLAMQAGHYYYLTNDVKITTSWSAKNGTVLC